MIITASLINMWKALKICNDIDKHFSVMGRMLAEGEYDGLKSYFNYMGHDMKQTKSSYLCDNRLINAILTDKMAEAESKGVGVSFTGNLPEEAAYTGKRPVQPLCQHAG